MRTEKIKIWAAFSPAGLFKLTRNNEGECWGRLCELQNAGVEALRKRGYRVVPGTFERDPDGKTSFDAQEAS